MKNLLLIQPNALLRAVYPGATWSRSREEKAIYLTFDDGPVPGLTEWVLDQLAHFNIKASFFCVGDNIRKHPWIFERIKKEGHTVANHTMFHTKGFKSTPEDYMKEVEECRQLVGTNLFRPPYGQLKRSQYNRLLEKGYEIVLWDVISYDFEQISEKDCADTVIKNTRNGSIVLFHDNIKAEQNMKHAVPLFIAHFLAKGYSFKTL